MSRLRARADIDQKDMKDTDRASHASCARAAKTNKRSVASVASPAPRAHHQKQRGERIEYYSNTTVITRGNLIPCGERVVGWEWLSAHRLCTNVMVADGLVAIIIVVLTISAASVIHLPIIHPQRRCPFRECVMVYMLIRVDHPSSNPEESTAKRGPKTHTHNAVPVRPARLLPPKPPAPRRRAQGPVGGDVHLRCPRMWKLAWQRCSLCSSHSPSSSSSTRRRSRHTPSRPLTRRTTLCRCTSTLLTGFLQSVLAVSVRQMIYKS